MMELAERCIVNVVSSAPGVALLAWLLWRQIQELRVRYVELGERLGSVERKAERICVRLNEEVTGRHTVPPDGPHRRKGRN